MRKPRETQQNGTYHICALINRQEMIFSPSYFDDKKKCILINEVENVDEETLNAFTAVWGL